MSMALTAPPTRKRFLIVACLFIGIFIAYLDRVNVSVLAANEPFLAYMGIEGMPLQIGMMMTVFLAAYGIANVVLSPLGDYLGPRKAMMLCILIWTIALMIGGVATSFALIIICRILLGIGEGFYYPLQSVFIKILVPEAGTRQSKRGVDRRPVSRSRHCDAFFHLVDRHPRLALQLLFMRRSWVNPTLATLAICC